MPRDVMSWNCAAAAIALAGMIGGPALAAEKGPIKLKRNFSRVVQRAQNSDEELFDSHLVDAPRLSRISESHPLVTPSPICEPETEYPSPYAPPASPDSMPSPLSSQAAAQPFAPFDAPASSIAGLTSADRVPSMMGDFFGAGSTMLTVTSDGTDIFTTQIPAGATTGVGILKLAENSSPIPRDRIFINYNYFTNVALTANGVNVNRFAPGFEKTFFDGLASFELRMPFATTLDSDIRGTTGFSSGAANDISATNVEFGNLTTTLKAYLYNNSRLAITGGLGIAFPTADDVTVTIDSIETMQFQNDAVRMMPFVGGLYTPNDRFFVQSILQVDVPTNGQKTLLNVTGDGLQDVGTYTPQTYLYFDTVFGYWIYNNFDSGAKISGIAGMFEVHYNSSLNDSDVIFIPDTSTTTGATIGQKDNFNQVNLLIGATIEFMRSSNLQLGYATTVGGDRVFDGELRCNYTYFFGRNLYGRSYRPSGI